MNIKKILITGGRAPVALDLARKFTRFGHEVYVAESVKYHLCLYSNAVKKCFLVPSPAKDSFNYINSLIDIIKKNKIDLLIPTCEEIFYISSHLEQLSQITNVFVDHLSKLDALHNKYIFNKNLEDNLISVPKTFLINSIEDYEKLINEGIIKYPHVLKPSYSRFASQAKIILKPELLSIDVSIKRPWVVQEYIWGRLICSYSVCVNGEILANVFYQNNYSMGKHGAGVSFRMIENELLYRWVASFVKKIKFTGQIGFDVIEASDGSFWPIECNPRATSGIHLFSDKLADAFLFHSLIKTNLPRKYPMLGLVMLMCGLTHARSFKKLSAWFKCFLSGKDVIFNWRDPLPFFTQILTMIHFFKVSRKYNIGIIPATTHDIEWDGSE